MYSNRVYLQICDDNWDVRDAMVACRCTFKFVNSRQRNYHNISNQDFHTIFRMLDFSIGIPRVGSKYVPVEMSLICDANFPGSAG